MNPEICRFCLKFNNLHSFFPISDELKDDFENLTNIELQLLPEHPKSICEFCLKFMQAVTAYKYQLIENQREFHVDMEVKAVFDLKIDNNMENHEVQHKEVDKMEGIKITKVESIKTMESPSSSIINTFTCNICGLNLCSQKNLSRHLILFESKTQIFECKDCSKKFHTKRGIKKHKTVDHSTASKNCIECNKAFHTDYGLEKHIQIQHEYKRYFCMVAYCKSKAFSTYKGCYNHIRNLHASVQVQDVKFHIKFDRVEDAKL